MPVTRAADAANYELHGFTFRSLAATGLGSPEIAVWAVDAPPRSSSPAHTMSQDEVLVVTSGRLVAQVADEQHEIGVGDAVTVPSGSLFCLSNPHDEPASVLATTRTGMQATVAGSTLSPPWAV